MNWKTITILLFMQNVVSLSTTYKVADRTKRASTDFVRLVNGGNPLSGRVEVFHNDTWGTVCLDSFTDGAARIVCRELGYSGGEALYLATFGRGEGQIWLDDVTCMGDEVRLADCQHAEWGVHDCYHLQDISIICVASRRSAEEFNNITRLVGGPHPWQGRLEIYHSGSWGSVSGITFESREAIVACRELGYRHGSVAGQAYGSGTGHIWIGRTDCTGNELTIADCALYGWGHDAIGHYRDISINCADPINIVEHVHYTPTDEITVRLVDGPTPWQGRVEILHDGVWGTICGFHFDYEDATVVCRELGYRHGSDEASRYGGGKGPIWMTSVSCTGTEEKISHCNHFRWGVSSCNHWYDASVHCADPIPRSDVLHAHLENTVRLIGGSSPTEGRVEVYHAGRWGSVCDDGWGDRHAEVVCRELGYSYTGVHVAMVDNQHGEGPDPIWLDDVICTGSEAKVTDCHHNPWGEHDCTHREDVGVRCDIAENEQPAPVEGDIRLVDGRVAWEGRVEVYHAGEWGYVCDDLWDIHPQNPHVACRQLGYTEGGVYQGGSLYGKGVTLWLDNVRCFGHETRLVDCEHSAWGRHNVMATGSYFTFSVALHCVPNVARDASMSEATSIVGAYEGQLRLSDGAYPWQGRVEVYRNHSWGTICNHDWGRQEAWVVCRQLGYQQGEPLVDLEYGRGSGAVHLDHVTCTGSEARVMMCDAQTADPLTCTHDNDVAVECLHL